MNTSASMYFGVRMSEQKDVRIFPPVPMVYENVPAEPQQWEYKVLIVDLRERELLGAEDLNELGSAGWLLIGSVRAGMTFNQFDELGAVGRQRAVTTFNQPDELGAAGRLREGDRQKIYYYFVRQKRA